MLSIFNSSTALTKFVPQSERIILTGPLIEINLLSALMNEDELSSSTTSRWTLRVVKQVKIMAQRFELAAPPRAFLVKMVQGPKVSMPTLVNGGPGMMRSSGRSAIFCC